MKASKHTSFSVERSALRYVRSDCPKAPRGLGAEPALIAGTVEVIGNDLRAAHPAVRDRNSESEVTIKSKSARCLGWLSSGRRLSLRQLGRAIGAVTIAVGSLAPTTGLTLMFWAPAASAISVGWGSIGDGCDDCESVRTFGGKGAFHAVSERQVALAPCVRRGPFSESEMLDYLDSLVDNLEAREDKLINGIAFKDEHPLLLKLFADIHKMPSYSYDPPLKFSSVCTKVRCAMSEIYQRRQGLQILFMFAKYGFNGSAHAAVPKENYDFWTADELDDLLLALETMPPELYPMDHNRELRRFKRGYTLKIYGADPVMANGRIDVFDPWTESSRENRVMALVHELGHVLTFQKDVKEPWLSVSGWEERKKPGTEEEEFVHTTNKVPSQYALSSPSEDLAESVTAYRFAASKFAREFPERYEFLKTEFFKGIEFQRVEQCQPSWDRAVAEQVARVKKRDSLQAQRIERRAIINDALVGLSPVIRPVIDERVMDAAMKRCWNPVLAEATGRPTNADACLENFIVETVIVAHVRRSGVRVFAGDVPNEMLARFRVETARMASLRTNINQHAAELLLDSFNKSLFTWADDKESCEASARGGNIESSFFSAWRVTDERGALKSPELFRELYRDACERLVDYHDAAFLPRALNPFGFNPFQIMLETKGRKNVGSSTR